MATGYTTNTTNANDNYLYANGGYQITDYPYGTSATELNPFQVNSLAYQAGTGRNGYEFLNPKQLEVLLKKGYISQSLYDSMIGAEGKPKSHKVKIEMEVLDTPFEKVNRFRELIVQLMLFMYGGSVTERDEEVMYAAIKHLLPEDFRPKETASAS